MFDKLKQMNNLAKKEQELENRVSKEKENLNQMKQALLAEKQKIEDEKQSLYALKDVFNDRSPKVRLKDLYILHLEDDDTYYIVRYSKTSTHGTVFTNIFDPKMTLKRSEFFEEGKIEYFPIEKLFVTATSLCHFDKKFLIYVNGKAPSYRLLELFYELNGISGKEIQEEAKILAKQI